MSRAPSSSPSTPCRCSGGRGRLDREFRLLRRFIADPLAAYCATKGAVHALTRAMACDHGPEGIRVNAVCPGYVDTPMLRSFFAGEGSGGGGGTIETLMQPVRDIHPTRRYGTPDDIANLVNWLAGPEARYASGQLWVIDGGLTAQVQQMRR
ncbi:MAG: SDR family oxidoreductase [Hyphomicrobiaceae bacterium]